ncbi:hypothetical protein SteCoe_6766 [Stentor coeruleus]|uniref:Phosphodiesterase n=1 Tax=Stentor coeruleus TaxID=5963 RepID=A0A1R2CP58_9CILI|nr:hypothetical protein SteCoe_6766 [Stentor coeruleus]
MFQVILLIVYLVNYLHLYREYKNYKSLVFELILVLIDIMLNVVFLLGGLTMQVFIVNRPWMISLNYFISCVVLILNDHPFQELVFDLQGKEHLPSLPGLLALILLNLDSATFNYKFLALCNFLIGVLYSVITLIESQEVIQILEVILLLSFLIYHTFHCYASELFSRLKYIESPNEIPEERQKIAPVEELSQAEVRLQDCMDQLRNVLPSVRSKIRDIVENVIRNLSLLVVDSKKIDFSYLDHLSEDMDEEDKMYIMQSCMPIKISRPSKMRRFQQRVSLDKIIEKLLSQDAIMILKQLSNNWNFNTFDFNEKTNKSPISVIGKYSFKLYNLIDAFSIPELKINFFLNDLQSNYKENPYHNAIHAADVLASGLFIISNSIITAHLSDLDIMIVILAHLGHDVGHPGLTNRFLVNFQDPLAIRYNDIAVLENMHASIVFSMLQEPDKNILENLSTDQFLLIRKWVIELILVTDMSKHFDLLTTFRNKGYLLKSLESTECKLEVLKMVIHASDIGHSAKDIDLHKKWSLLLAEEFFHQGDIEKAHSQPVSMYCDRDTTILPKSQIGFLKNIALPLFEILSNFLDTPNIYSLLDHLKNNISVWEYEYSAGKLKTLKDPTPFKYLADPSPNIKSFSSMANYMLK